MSERGSNTTIPVNRGLLARFWAVCQQKDEPDFLAWMQAGDYESFSSPLVHAKITAAQAWKNLPDRVRPRIAFSDESTGMPLALEKQ